MAPCEGAPIRLSTLHEIFFSFLFFPFPLSLSPFNALSQTLFNFFSHVFFLPAPPPGFPKRPWWPSPNPPNGVRGWTISWGEVLIRIEGNPMSMREIRPIRWTQSLCRQPLFVLQHVDFFLHLRYVGLPVHCVTITRMVYPILLRI